jgi:GH18 family chitinase
VCQAGYGSCAVVEPKTCGVDSGTSNGRTIAYYQGSNVYNRLCNQIHPADIDTSQYTHLYYAFASVDPATFAVVPSDIKDEDIYAEFTALQRLGVETWIAVGGFDFSDDNTSTHQTWSQRKSKEFPVFNFLFLGVVQREKCIKREDLISYIPHLPQAGFANSSHQWSVQKPREKLSPLR